MTPSHQLQVVDSSLFRGLVAFEPRQALNKKIEQKSQHYPVTE